MGPQFFYPKPLRMSACLCLDLFGESQFPLSLSVDSQSNPPRPTRSGSLLSKHKRPIQPRFYELSLPQNRLPHFLDTSRDVVERACFRGRFVPCSGRYPPVQTNDLGSSLLYVPPLLKTRSFCSPLLQQLLLNHFFSLCPRLFLPSHHFCSILSRVPRRAARLSCPLVTCRSNFTMFTISLGDGPL